MFVPDSGGDGVRLGEVFVGVVRTRAAPGRGDGRVRDELPVHAQPVRVVLAHLGLDPVGLCCSKEEALLGPAVAEVDPRGGGGKVRVTKIVSTLHGNLSSVRQRRIRQIS